MALVLMWNIFEFDMNLFIQMIGTAMGTIAYPTFANLFMGKKKVFPNTNEMRLRREDYWIRTLQSKAPKGLNRNSLT